MFLVLYAPGSHLWGIVRSMICSILDHHCIEGAFVNTKSDGQKCMVRLCYKKKIGKVNSFCNSQRLTSPGGAPFVHFVFAVAQEENSLLST